MNAVLNMPIERDGRTMNHMDPETKRVHLRLESWGRWSQCAELRAYPETTVIGRMIVYGPLGAGQEGPGPTSMPDEIAAVDAAVARLWGPGKQAILRYYTRQEPIEVSAKACDCKVRQFQLILARARWLLHGWLGL